MHAAGACIAHSVGVEGAIAQLDGEGPTHHLDHRRPRSFGVRPRKTGAGEVAGEALGVDGGAGDDHLQVGTLRKQLLEIAEDEVDVEAALVGLVDDQRVVAAQHPVALDLREEDAVGHHLDERRVTHLVGEPHGVAHVGAERRSEFVGDAFGDRAGRHPAGLGVPDHPLDPTPGFETHLGKLGALARAGLPSHDHHLVLPDRCQQLLSSLGDRQRFGIRQSTTVDDGDSRSAARVIEEI